MIQMYQPLKWGLAIVLFIPVVIGALIYFYFREEYYYRDREEMFI